MEMVRFSDVKRIYFRLITFDALIAAAPSP